MGSVVNSDGSIRVMNDLSFPRKETDIPSVNFFVDKNDYQTTWDNFEIVAEFLKGHKEPLELAIFDWEKAYRQLPIHISQRPFLCVMDFQGKIWIELRIGFGGVASCGVFGSVADIWKKIIHRLLSLEQVFCWVDDNLMIRKQGQKVKMEDIENLSRALGVKTNTKKNHNFSDEQKYIGFVWNGKEKSVRLPDKKLKIRKQQVEEFLEEDKLWTYKDLEKFVGRLNHVCYILPNMRCYMRSLYCWMKEWHNREATRRIPLDVKEDLVEWKRNLHDFTNLRIIPSRKAEEIYWVGDAAESFGIGVKIGQHWAQFKLKTGWNNVDSRGQRREIAWAKTAAVRMGY